MFRRPSKKQMLIQRLIVAAVMTISVVIIATGTILFVLGYRLDSENGRLEQGALVQFESSPSGADVAIDGEGLNARTATKASVMAGTHSFMMTREGYRPWAKTLALAPGTLTWLNYVRFVPNEIRTETVTSYNSVVGAKASPDNRRLAIQEKADVPTYRLLNLQSQNVTSTSLIVPKDAYSDASKKGVKHTFNLVRWDRGSRYLLLKHTYDQKSEWIVVDTENASRSVNVSSLLSISLNDVRFSGTSGRIMYGLTNDGTIRKLDLSEATISRALVTDVERFDLFETDTITYIGKDPNDSKKRVAGLYREGDSKPHILRTINESDGPLAIATSRYYSDNYVAIAEGLKVTVLKGRYPASGSEDTSSLQTHGEFTMPARVDQLMFSPDGDAVIARAGLNFVSYEVEHQRQTNAVIETSETKARDLQWLDETHLWVVYDGQVSMRDFDGTNAHQINKAEPGLDVLLSQNGRYIYSVVKVNNEYQLQRAVMVLN